MSDAVGSEYVPRWYSGDFEGDHGACVCGAIWSASKSSMYLIPAGWLALE